jgi:hypothetical protein
VTTGQNDVDQIYDRMAVIRRERHTNVRDSVAGAEAFMDWGRYTWTYPWIAVAAAAAVSYMIYTGSHQGVTADRESLAGGAGAREPDPGARARGGNWAAAGQNLLLGAWGIVLPVAVAAGQNYVLHWLERQYPTTMVPDRPTSDQGTGRPDGTGRAEAR